MERWTRFVLRHRWWVVAVWFAVFVTGGYLSSDLNRLLSNEFIVPNTDSENARVLLKDHFGQRDDGSFLVVARVEDASEREARGALAAALRRGAAVLPGGKAQPVQTTGEGVLFGTIATPLDLTDAKARTDEVRRAVGDPPGLEVYVSGTPAIQADLDPIFEEDLLKGEPRSGSSGWSRTT